VLPFVDSPGDTSVRKQLFQMLKGAINIEPSN